MAWIELHQSVWSHKKTMLLADRLGIPDIYAAAHMAHLWCWAIDNAPTGDLSGLPPRIIAKGAGWQGDPEAFVEAAIAAGYIDRDGDRLVLHDWPEYAERLIEHREARRARSEDGARGNHERWHVRRGIVEPSCPYCREEQKQPAGTPASPEIGGDIGGESPPDRGAISGGDRGGESQPNLTQPQKDVVVVVARAREEGSQAEGVDGGEEPPPPQPPRIGPDPIEPPEDLRAISDAYMGVTGRPLLPGDDVRAVREALDIATVDQVLRAIEIGSRTFRPKYPGDKISSFRYFLPVVRRVVAEDTQRILAQDAAAREPALAGRHPPRASRDFSDLYEMGA